jgi:hypothetical protein
MSQESMSLEVEVEALRATKIGLFTLDAIKKVSNVRENVERTKGKFSKLLEYFGEEDKKKMNPHDLFETIVLFSRDFDIALEGVAKAEKQKKRAEKKKEGKRAQSPSSKSRDSTRDEDSSRRNSLTPTRQPKVPTNKPNSTPTRPLRASSLQPHMQLMKSIKSKTKEVVITKQQRNVEAPPVKQKKSTHVIEYNMVDTKEMNPPSLGHVEEQHQQQFSDDSISRATSEFSDGKNVSTKTMTTTSDSISDSESQTQCRNSIPSDDSKEGSDENAVPGFSIDESSYHSSNSHTKQFTNDILDENIHSSLKRKPNRSLKNAQKSPLRQKSPSRQVQEAPSVPISVGPTVNSPLRSSDQEPTPRKISDRQSMRLRARALRHQRAVSQRQATNNSPVKQARPKTDMHERRSNDHPTRQHHQVRAPLESQTQSTPRQHHSHDESRQPRHNNNGQNDIIQRPSRRKPPSPEDIRPRASSQLSTHSSPSTSLSMSQERIRTRRDRIERRRRIET